MDSPSLEFWPSCREMADGREARLGTFARRVQQLFASARNPNSRPSRAPPGAGPLDPEFYMEEYKAT
eukprot:2575455-Lingulodinium_polyedra.AAC.1